MPRTTAVLIAAAFALMAAPAFADQVRLSANLDGKKEVPMVETAGTATATVLFDEDSRGVTWDVYWTGITGDPMAAHFHGPARPGNNAGVQVDLGANGFANPLRGSAQLTDEQAKQLLAGEWYINIHTAAHPDGEIRGQIERQP